MINRPDTTSATKRKNGTVAFENCVYGFPMAVLVYAECFALLANITQLGRRALITQTWTRAEGLAVKIDT